MLDGPARPMTGIQGAGYPGTAQVLIYTVHTTMYSVQCMYQGYNARKVISEVYASFVLQFNVSGR